MKMNKALCIFSLLLLNVNAFSQESWADVRNNGAGTLTVYIQEEFPFAFYEDGELRGIEVDILKKFAEWTESRTGVRLDLQFERYHSFVQLYEGVRENENVVGAAFITMNEERSNEVKFTPTYLKNASVLVSPMHFPVMKGFYLFDKIFADKTALVIRGTTHEKRLMEIRDKYHPDMRVKYVNESEEMIPYLTADDSKYYAMIDLITFWKFVKRNNGGLKLHRAATVDKEEYGFILPEGSDWQEPFEKFFNEGFGFTASEDYEVILNRYLGEEVVETVIMK